MYQSASGWLFFDTWHLEGFKLQTWGDTAEISERCKIVFIVRWQIDPQKQTDWQTHVHSAKTEDWISNQHIKNYIIVHTHKMAKHNCSVTTWPKLCVIFCAQLCNTSNFLSTIFASFINLGQKVLKNYKIVLQH